MQCGSPALVNNMKTIQKDENRLISVPCSLKTDAWEWRDPLPSGNKQNAIAFGNNMFVVVADGGTIFTSPDGITWQRGNLCTYHDFNDITFGSGQFVAVGDSGTIFASSDGHAWYKREPETIGQLFSVTHGNGTFVAIDYFGTIYSSTDAIHWKSHQIEDFDCRAIVFGSGLFAVAGYSGKLFTSTDGISWTRRNIFNEQRSDGKSITSLSYLNNMFFCKIAQSNGSSFSISSPDCSTWTIDTNPPQLLSECVFGLSKFVAIKPNNSICISPNAVTWTCTLNNQSVIPQKSLWLALRGVVYGDSQFVACGTEGSIFTSRDAVSWRQVQTTITDDFKSIFYKANRYIAISDTSGVFLSSDAHNWKKVASGKFKDFMPLVRGNGISVAVGNSGRILTLTFGNTWIQRVSDADNSPLTATAYGAGQFVAVGEKGIVLSSHDGLTWKTRYSGTVETLQSVTYAAGGFKAVGNYGVIITSTDGISWSREISGTSNFIQGITHGRGQFVAVGSCGILASKTDSETIHRQADDHPGLNDSIVGLLGLCVATINRSGDFTLSDPIQPTENVTYPDTLLDDPISVLEDICARDQPIATSDDLNDKYKYFLNWKSSIPAFPPEFLIALNSVSSDMRYKEAIKKMSLLYSKETAQILLTTRNFYKRQPAILKSFQSMLLAHMGRDSMCFWTIPHYQNDTQYIHDECFLFWAEHENERSASLSEAFLKSVAAINYPDIIDNSSKVSPTKSPSTKPVPIVFGMDIENIDCINGLTYNYYPYATVVMNSFENDRDTLTVNDPLLWQTMTTLGSRLFDSRLTYYAFFLTSKRKGQWEKIALQPKLTMFREPTEQEDALLLSVHIDPKGKSKRPLFYAGLPTEEWVNKGKKPSGFFLSEPISDTIAINSAHPETDEISKAMKEYNIPEGPIYFSVPPSQHKISKIIKENLMGETHSGSLYAYSIVKIIMASGDTVKVETREDKFRWTQESYYEGGGVLTNAPIFIDINGDGLYDFVWETGPTRYFFFLQLPNGSFDVWRI
jgi:photosystem II stability/assembly factor-like uncharacterized protein